MSVMEPILQTRKARLRRIQSYSLRAAESGFNQRSAQLQSQFSSLRQCLEMLVRINPSLQDVLRSLSSLEVFFTPCPRPATWRRKDHSWEYRINDDFCPPTPSAGQPDGRRTMREDLSTQELWKSFHSAIIWTNHFHSFKDFDNLSPG